MKKFFLSLALLCSFNLSAIAQSTPQQVVKQAVENTTRAVQTSSAAKNGDMKAVAEIVQKQFIPFTDFNRTTRIVLGDVWNKASPAQQARLYQEFSTLMTHFYAASLAQLGSQNIRFNFKTSAQTNRDALVTSSFRNGADQQTVQYRLNKTAQGWKIYDIDLSGIWLIQIYQKQFAQILSQNNINGLIEYLSKHNARSF